MPSKAQDRDRDRDKDGTKTRDKVRHKTSRSSRRTSKDHIKDSAGPERSSTLTPSSTKRRSSMPVPELERRASSSSPRGSKTSLPYPSFSKAHSKEAVGSREDMLTPRLSLYTPDPTDLNGKKQGDEVQDTQETSRPTRAPPSPPLTTVDQDLESDRKTNDEQSVTGDPKSKMVQVPDEAQHEEKAELNSQSRLKGTFTRSTKGSSRSNTSTPQRSKPGTPSKKRPKPVTIDDASSFTDRREAASLTQSSVLHDESAKGSSIDSSSTSIAPNQQSARQVAAQEADSRSENTSNSNTSQRTPTPRGTPFSAGVGPTPTFVSPGLQRFASVNNVESPMPPPPPPPPEMPFQLPRVDYLMQNGGLQQSIPRTFLGVGQSFPTYQSNGQQMQSTLPVSAQVEKIFSPFNGLLDDYSKVISKNGSIAVATGYRSIARRLLDRLEAVFARDISSETCSCIICESVSRSEQNLEDERGISWGEILEYVCGRQELPPWPAFALDATPVGLGISASEQRSPMQKLDIDVPEEYRDHYIRQSKKTKQSVDRWLASQPENPSSPPDEVDDETLTFAMLTHLDSELRPIFSSLLGFTSNSLGSRAATPIARPRSEILEKTGLAIQRLYRLGTTPRDPECAIYLLNNPSLHNVLATLAAVSDGEWEILTSGRFDGFLRSGAEDHSVNQATSNAPSRGTTPANGRASAPPRGTTPQLSMFPSKPSASAGAPVAMDEETEIAILAEVEREIYLGMEALEDAFEALHLKAEYVRQALRERGAGLSMANQVRRGGNDVEARLGTPASAFGGGGRGWESETDDGIDDTMSELAPDDSASNVSSSRHRRPKRRNERRTPAPVEEEDEEK
ncbi:hypothetical protein MMC20_008115 [Loxospora ochrophaea]|nr:hypothetical protein [Loxospora ochrophaea]